MIYGSGNNIVVHDECSAYNRELRLASHELHELELEGSLLFKDSKCTMTMVNVSKRCHVMPMLMCQV